jgi:K+:H+ antiporter
MERGRLRVMFGYALMIASAVGVFWFIRRHGDGLTAPDPTGAATARFGAGHGGPHVDALLHVLLALGVVIVLARAVGALFKYFAQPAVVGEIIAGIMLGPSLLGRVAPHVAEYILPKSVGSYLQVLSQVGVILYMFLVGLELDPRLMRNRGHTTVAISHASIITPFLLGAALALWLYPQFATNDVPFVCFALFLGVSMSVTAFPVLARILTDRKIHKTRMGAISLTCAAVDDVTAWCLLAFVVSVVQARLTGALFTFGMSVGFIALMIFVVRPLMVRLSRVYGNRGRLTQGVMAAVFVALLASALATDYIGIHAVFGAFALGAVIPHDSGMARELTDRLEDLVVVLLLPAFFAYTGMHTEIGLVSGWHDWIFCGLIILVASLGKFGGSMIAARLTGLGWRDASALGVLMNTRGLMELIVLNIGFELRVISPTLFSMLVLMAVVTTFATTPVLHLLTRRHRFEDDVAPPEKPRQDERAGGLLVPISNPQARVPLLARASAATRPNDPPPRVLALVRRPPGGIRSGLRELADPPSPSIVAQAIDFATRRGFPVETQAIWTDHPATDILHGAADARIGWLLLGFHRPVFGADMLGGVVKEVLERADPKGAHIGIVVHSHERPIDRVVAVVDAGVHGRAALELAARIAHSRSSTLHAVLSPSAGREPEADLEVLLKETARTAGRWLHTDVLERGDRDELEQKTAADLVVIGLGLADRIGFPVGTGETPPCVILVQGADRPPPAAATTAAAS